MRTKQENRGGGEGRGGGVITFFEGDINRESLHNVSSKYIAIVKLLLMGKARVQIGDRRGLTPLDRARIAGAKDVVLLLKGYLNTARSNNDDSTEVCETGRFNTANKPSIAETIQYPGTLRIGQPEGPRPSWLPMMLRDHLRVGAKTSIFGDKLEFFPKEVLLRCLNRESVATDLGKNLESSFAEDAFVKIFPVVGKGSHTLFSR